MIHRMDPPEDPDAPGAARTICGRCSRRSSDAAAARRRLGVGAEVGRHPRARLRRRRAHPPLHPQRQRRDASLSRAAPARRGARRTRRRARRRDRRVRRRRAARASSCCSGACTSTSDVDDPPARRRGAGHLRAVRRALARRPFDDGAAVRASGAHACASSSSTARRGRRRRTRTATATRRSR